MISMRINIRDNVSPCVQFTIFQCASVQIHKDIWSWFTLFAQSRKLTFDLYLLDKCCSSNMYYFKYWCTCYLILYYCHNKTITYLPKRVCLCLHYPAMHKNIFGRQRRARTNDGYTVYTNIFGRRLYIQIYLEDKEEPGPGRRLLWGEVDDKCSVVMHC